MPTPRPRRSRPGSGRGWDRSWPARRSTAPPRCWSRTGRPRAIGPAGPVGERADRVPAAVGAAHGDGSGVGRTPVGAAGWTAADIPDQRGRTFIVTGASSGLGAVTARELARAGARVILGVRNPAKGWEVAAAIAALPGLRGAAEPRQLDLADLASVRAFAAGIEDD